MRRNLLLVALLLGCSGRPPAVRPLEHASGLQCGIGSGVLVIRDAESWQAFVARQPTEPALRLRDLSIDFARESFVLACHTATSGSTKVRFAEPAFEDGVLVIEARTSTPSGPVRADVVRHCYAAVVGRPAVRAALVVDGRRIGTTPPP